jgi:hypothetical protein
MRKPMHPGVPIPTRIAVVVIVLTVLASAHPMGAQPARVHRIGFILSSAHLGPLPGLENNLLPESSHQGLKSCRGQAFPHFIERIGAMVPLDGHGPHALEHGEGRLP